MADGITQKRVDSMSTHNRKWLNVFGYLIKSSKTFAFFPPIISLDNKSQGRQSVASAKPGPESDTDSMAEYGEGDTGKSRCDNLVWIPLIMV